MKSAIYKITNIDTGMCYVGSAINVNKRWYEHKRQLNKDEHANRYLQFAWNKYGKDNFIFEILETINSKEDLLVREQYWIDFLECLAPNGGYNLAPKAGSQLGFRHNIEARLKVSIAAKNISDETRTKMKQHIFSEEHKKNMSIAWEKRKARGEVFSKETREKISKAGKGRVRSPEHSAKIAEGLKRAWARRKALANG